MESASIGICAYNEENNIGKLLDNLREQIGNEIIVVASGCTDDTVEIVDSKKAKDDRIKLFVQEQREGKSSAANLFIKNSSNNLLVLLSADILPDNDAIEKLIQVFKDDKIGMAGARPIPVNTHKTFIGFCVNYMWQLHHLIALQDPKCGEMIAFRKVFEQIPAESAVDEASIEEKIRKKGLEIKYVPEAVVRNMGPKSISDFIKQRRRIALGHHWLKKNKGYEVSTLNGGKIINLILANMPKGLLKKIWVIGMIKLEIWSRFLGWWDYTVLKKNAHIWKVAKTTKKL
ncbi:glycosyltransferase [Patescibacteria group bacterium]|nr:glycosyltransferase [Patescibacteria group bacterium]MBU1672998.1 glycosyltransferase [Patescibacteria group bacterium]MBU1962967.1 glycosyltransferase [Patescibacteria group bacterium]